MVGLWLPTVQYNLLRDTKKFNRIHREGIKIYTGTFKTSPVESMHAEAYNTTMEPWKKKERTGAEIPL